MKLALDSIILFVKNIEKLKEFYIGLLGLELLEETDGWLLLKAGNVNIGLHKIGEEYASNDGKPFKVESNTKLVFDVEEDIYKLRDHLLFNGIEIKEIKTFPNYPFLICDGEDVEGNVFQLKQRIK